MPVYVDPVMTHGGSATFKWKDSCHMYADTEVELHAFAKKIGLKREWFQLGRRQQFPHYDLNVGRHRAAIAQGAIQHDRDQAVDFWQKMGFLRKFPPAAEQIPGPCSYCGAPDHWRPDCLKLAPPKFLF